MGEQRVGKMPDSVIFSEGFGCSTEGCNNKKDSPCDWRNPFEESVSECSSPVCCLTVIGTLFGACGTAGRTVESPCFSLADAGACPCVGTAGSLLGIAWIRGEISAVPGIRISATVMLFVRIQAVVVTKISVGAFCVTMQSLLLSLILDTIVPTVMATLSAVASARAGISAAASVASPSLGMVVMSSLVPVAHAHPSVGSHVAVGTDAVMFPMAETTPIADVDCRTGKVVVSPAVAVEDRIIPSCAHPADRTEKVVNGGIESVLPFIQYISEVLVPVAPVAAVQVTGA